MPREKNIFAPCNIGFHAEVKAYCARKERRLKKRTTIQEETIRLWTKELFEDKRRMRYLKKVKEDLNTNGNDLPKEA